MVYVQVQYAMPIYFIATILRELSDTYTDRRWIIECIPFYLHCYNCVLHSYRRAKCCKKNIKGNRAVGDASVTLYQIPIIPRKWSSLGCLCVRVCLVECMMVTLRASASDDRSNACRVSDIKRRTLYGYYWIAIVGYRESIQCYLRV